MKSKKECDANKEEQTKFFMTIRRDQKGRTKETIWFNKLKEEMF